LSKVRDRTVEVEIYDQKYSIILKTPLSNNEVCKLAAEIDGRMRDIAAQTNMPDSLKVAVLTALHLAQEYKELRDRCEQKTEDLSQALEAVLR
jgi:cell division protein ZapA (FtsZ GTPase activity inhibitor)